MSKIYLIEHVQSDDYYDEYRDCFDGYASYDTCVKITTSEEFAKAYVEKWNKPLCREYDHFLHKLKYRVLEIDNFDLDTPPTNRWAQECTEFPEYEGSIEEPEYSNGSAWDYFESDFLREEAE